MANVIWQSRGSTSGTAGANWGGSAPASSDSVFFQSFSSIPVAGADLSASTSVVLEQRDSYVGAIGDRDGAFQIGATVVRLGVADGPTPNPNPGRVHLDTGSQATAFEIFSSARTAIDPGFQPIRLKCNSGSATLKNRKGFCELAGYIGETSTIATIDVGEMGMPADGCFQLIGSGVTLTTLNVHGGSAMLKCAATTVTVRGGALQTEGSGAITTVNARGGTLKLHATGTIGTLNASDGAVIDFSGSNAARTVSTLAISGPCRIITAPGVTFTAITFTSNVPLEIRVGLLSQLAA